MVALLSLTRISCSGNGLIVGSSTSAILGLTWGGVAYPWVSANVLVPLVLGLVGIGAFLVYEARYAKHPLVSFLHSSPLYHTDALRTQVPWSIVSNRTSLSGFVDLHRCFNSQLTPLQLRPDIHQPNHHDRRRL